MGVERYSRSGVVIEIDRARGTLFFKSISHRVLTMVALSVGSAAVAPLVVTRVRPDMNLTLSGVAWVALLGLGAVACAVYALKSAAAGACTIDLEKRALVVASGFGVRRRASDLRDVTFDVRRTVTTVGQHSVASVAMVAASPDQDDAELVSLTLDHEPAVADLASAVTACVADPRDPRDERDDALRRVCACAERLPDDRAARIPLALCLLVVPIASCWLVATYLSE